MFMRPITKNKLRTISLVLFLCMISAVLIGCKKTQEDIGTDTTKTEPSKTVAVVVSAQASDAQTEIADKLSSLCEEVGYAVSNNSDADSESEEGYKIFVGCVERELSAVHISELGKCGYGVKVEGRELSVCATGDAFLEFAAKNIIAQGFCSDGLFDNISSENVIYDELLYAVEGSGIKMTVSGDASVDGVKAAMTELTSSLSSLLKKQVTFTEGDSGDIVFISPEAAVSKDIASVLRYNEYAIAPKDGKIYVYSCEQSGYVIAANRLIKIMKDISNYKETKSLFYPAELCLSEEIDAKVPMVPKIDGGLVYDVAISGSYTIALEAKKQVFLSYGDKVVADGYTLVEERTDDVSYMNDSNSYTNIYRTYINDEYMIYMYFLDNKNRIRIVGSNISEYEQLKACEATDGDIESKFTMLNIGGENPDPEFESDSGMAFAVRLSDGRFIVIDGGIWSNNDSEAGEVVRLYNYLADNSSNGEIRIAAWIFTHIHVDHVNVAWKFEQMYGKQVTIERYMHNFIEYDCLLSIDGTDLSKSTYDLIYPRTLDMLSRYDNAIMHTGQIYNIGNASIEILYTHEDFYPNPLTIVNNSSTIFKINIEGNTILITGDAQEDAQQTALENQGYDLCSDFVQMTHHGWNGLRDFYRYAEGGSYTIALCPKNVGSSPVNTTANKWLMSNSDEFYIASSGVKEFVLPYNKK